MPSLLFSRLHREAELTWPGHAVEQLALADFIARGRFARHIQRMRRLYAERRAALLQALATHLGDWLTPAGGSGGLHLTVRLNPALALRDTEVAAAARLGLAIRPLSPYGTTAPSLQGFLLGFAAYPAEGMEASVLTLRWAMERVMGMGMGGEGE